MGAIDRQEGGALDNILGAKNCNAQILSRQHLLYNYGRF